MIVTITAAAARGALETIARRRGATARAPRLSRRRARRAGARRGWCRWWRRRAWRPLCTPTSRGSSRANAAGGWCTRWLARPRLTTSNLTSHRQWRARGSTDVNSQRVQA
eukprot:1485005-Prymnesium_polylepis.1